MPLGLTKRLQQGRVQRNGCTERLNEHCFYTHPTERSSWLVARRRAVTAQALSP